MNKPAMMRMYRSTVISMTPIFKNFRPLQSLG
jgi:hypothetical protein